MVPLSSKGIQTANSYVLTGKYHTMQPRGGHKGVRIPQNCTELRTNTAQNEIRKPQTALKLPENFKYRKLLSLVKPQDRNLK